MSVEQAADRLRNIASRLRRYGDPDTCREDAENAELGQMVCDLFDPTPLSEEILCANGWVPLCYRPWFFVNPEYRVEFMNDTPEGFEVWSEDGAGIGSVFTVGDLRRLLSALHIDVEVRLP